MENLKKKTISLLSNEPCKDDAFKGQAHKNIAKQISRIIKEDAKRHIIGLEGGWGSGKSNLISMVNIELNGKNVYDEKFDHTKTNYPFYVYDAWGHQSDPQRRSILEELIHDLIWVKKIFGKEWKQMLEDLLAKKKNVKTKEIPRLGPGVIVGLILCFLTPVINHCVNIIPKEETAWRLTVAVTPYILGIIILLICKLVNMLRKKEKFSFSRMFSELFIIYKDKVKENETFTTISEKEPSSAVFKKWMDKVNDTIKDQNKTLVIVFDNMDRLPSEKVGALWSSIHSFFSDKTYTNIKVIIPFDRKHVQKAFKGEDIENESYGNDFINKTFDVVFRVAPPIMRGWQTYMIDKWKEAFDSELHISVLQIYDALCKKYTPRNIIAFINEMATIKMTLNDDIPDAYIALFIFGREKIEEEPVKVLLHPNFMGDMSFEYENDPNTIKYLSALYYQLPVDDAMDVVFTQEALEALNSCNGDRLCEMIEKMDISPYLGKAIRDVSNIENASIAMAAIDKALDYGDFLDMPSWLKEIWENLYEKANKNNVDWSNISDFHVTLYHHLYSEKMAEKLVQSYLSIDDDKWNAQKFVEIIKELRKDDDIIDNCLDKHKRKVKPVLFLEILRYAEDEYEDYGVTCDFAELDEYLAGLDKEKVLQLNVIPYVGAGKNSWTKYEAQLKKWIKDDTIIDTNEIGSLFTRLKEVVKRIGSAEDLIDDDRLDAAWRDVADSAKPFKYDLLAMRIARGKTFSTVHKEDFDDILNTDDEDSVKKLARVIELYIHYGSLMENSNYYKSQPITVAAFNYLTSHFVRPSNARIMDCLPRFDIAIADYGTDASALYNKLNGWSEYFAFDNTNIVKMPDGLFKQAEAIDNALTKALHKACVDYYDSLTQEEWKAHILAKDSTWRIWKNYHPKKISSVRDALKSLLKDYADGTTTTQPDVNLVNEWLGILVELKHSLKSMYDEICNLLKNGQRVTAEKLLFFGEDILKYADMTKHSDFVEKLLPTDIIDDDDVLAFVDNNIDKLKMCNIPDEFKEKLKELAETTRRDEQDVVNICSVLGIEIAAPVEEEGTVDENTDGEK